MIQHAPYCETIRLSKLRNRPPDIIITENLTDQSNSGFEMDDPTEAKNLDHNLMYPGHLGSNFTTTTINLSEVEHQKLEPMPERIDFFLSNNSRKSILVMIVLMLVLLLLLFIATL